MRKIIARGFGLELVSLIALLLSIIVAWAGSTMALPSEVVLTASIGIAVAAYIWALKWELLRDVLDKLSLYSLLESIEDEELYAQGKRAVDKCRVQLENLADGILEVEKGNIIPYVMRFLDKARYSYKATHVWHLTNEAYVASEKENRYYQQNVELVQRGVKVDRIFLLRENLELDHQTGKIKEEVAKVIRRQHQDGITVHVAWVEQVETSRFLSDFLLVDDNLVGIPQYGSAGAYSSIRIVSRQAEIRQYVEGFDSLLARALNYEDFKDLLP